MSELPKGWKALSFIDLLDVNGGTQPPKSEFISEPQEGYVRLLQIRDFGAKPVPTYIPDTYKLRKCATDDILIGRYGASLGRICTGMSGSYNVALAKVVIPELLEKQFIKYYLDSSLFQEPLRLLSRSAQNGFNKNDLKEFVLHLAPLEEQKRIVEKLDQVLAQVDTIKARLDGIPAILKRFRQSVLAAAVSGKLTEEWRGGESFNANIQLENLRDARKLFFKVKGSKEKEPKRLKIKELHFCIPDTWVLEYIDIYLSYNRVGMKTGPFGSLLKKHEHENNGIPVLGIENIGRDKFIFGSKIHITKNKAKELDSYNILSGDVVISRSGTVGEICVIPEKLGTARFSTNLMRLSFNNQYIKPNYFSKLFLGSPLVLSQVKELCKGSTREFLNQSILSSIKYPIPPIEEQIEIVRLVDQYFAFADTIEKQVQKAQQRVDKLTQSILAKAFRGELVPQDPTDEPADELLKRIATVHTESEALAKATKKVGMRK